MNKEYTMKHIFKWTIPVLMLSLHFYLRAGDVIVWQLETGAGIVAAPLVHEGTVYVGSIDKHFYAVDALTGEINWQFETGDQIRSDASVFGNTVCFESGNQLYAMSLQGELLWQYPLYSENLHNQYDSWNYFHSSPNIADGIAYTGTEMGRVVGVNMNDGTQAFLCETGNEHGIRVTPAVYNKRIYFGDWNGVFYAFDLTTGEQVWQYDTKKDNTYDWINAIQTRVVIHNGIIYFAGRSCNVYALNPEDGALIWKWHSPTNEWMIGGPVIQGDMLYIGSSNQHLFYGFDLESGTVRFQSLLDYRVFGGGRINGNQAYVGSGSFYSVDINSGEVLKRLPTERDIVSVPALANGILYFGCNDGRLFAVDRAEFDEMPLSKTWIDDTSQIDLGDIPVNTTSECQVVLHNTGEGPDSILVSLSGGTKIKRAFTINHENFTLQAGDSAVLDIILNPEDLKQDDYSVKLMIHSQYNLQNNDFNIPVLFSVVEATDAGQPDTGMPHGFSLNQNYPNPFNPETEITYTLPRQSEVTLTVYDALGQEIRRLIHGTQPAGVHQVAFNGSRHCSGIYLCVLAAGGRTARRKMMLIR